MKSFTESQSLILKMAKVASTDTANVATLTSFWNDSIRTMCNIRGGKWWFLETTKDVATVASQRGYAIPAKIRKLMSLYVTVGTTVYTPTPIFDNNTWNKILAANYAVSDTPLFYYVQGHTVQMAPAPSSTAGTITMRGRLNLADLNVADTSVTVTTLANGGTAVTTSAGALVTMAGKYLRITADAAGAAAKGDGFWYEISSASPTTSITLVAPYQGVSLAAASAAATVGQMSPIPESYEMAPIYRSLALYAQINDPLHPNVAAGWWKLYDGGQEAGMSQTPAGLIGQMLENESETVEGNYISPNAIGNLDPNTPPQQELTGFS